LVLRAFRPSPSTPAKKPGAPRGESRPWGIIAEPKIYTIKQGISATSWIKTSVPLGMAALLFPYFILQLLMEVTALGIPLLGHDEQSLTLAFFFPQLPEITFFPGVL
jgi:hypothetical protein